MLLSSEASASYSDCIAVLSEVVDDASADWVARSFMRIRMLLVSPSAPSAVCIIEIAFWVLRMAMAIPLVCALRRVAICRPAASSIAELMRKPVLRRVIEVDRLLWVRLIELCADRAALLV